MSAPLALAELYASAFDRAAAGGFALFPHGVAAANPVNAAPYVCSPDAFVAAFAFTARRQALVGEWNRLVQDMAGRGLIAVFTLVGGSVLDRGQGEPRDLDCAIFYRAPADAADGAAWLTQRAREAARGGIDPRFVPIDGPPIVLAKALAFFTLLYAQSRPGRACHGLALIDHEAP